MHNAYHRYAVEWTEDSLTFYVDGNEYYSWTASNTSDHNQWPFNTDFHLILNIAVGGTWGGQQGIRDGEWETSMLVDYVRVYQEE